MISVIEDWWPSESPWTFPICSNDCANSLNNPELYLGSPCTSLASFFPNQHPNYCSDDTKYDLVNGTATPPIVRFPFDLSTFTCLVPWPSTLIHHRVVRLLWAKCPRAPLPFLPLYNSWCQYPLKILTFGSSGYNLSPFTRWLVSNHHARRFNLIRDVSLCMRPINIQLHVLSLLENITSNESGCDVLQRMQIVMIESYLTDVVNYNIIDPLHSQLAGNT